MRWLCSHGAPAQDVAVYISSLRDLFHLPSEEEYCLKLDQMASRWSAPFYMSTIATTYILTFMQLHGWQLSHNYGVYDSYSGVTSNQAEGLNYVLKQLWEGHESSVDCMVLALYYLQDTILWKSAVVTKD